MVVLYCSVMGLASFIACQCMTIIVCISYIMAHSNYGLGSVED